MSVPSAALRCKKHNNRVKQTRRERGPYKEETKDQKKMSDKYHDRNRREKFPSSLSPTPVYSETDNRLR